MAADPTTNRVYVTNRAGNSVSVIDGAIHTVLGTINLPANAAPRGVAIRPGSAGVASRIYVANSGLNSITIINGATGSFGQIEFTFTSGVGTTPWGIAYNSANDIERFDSVEALRQALLAFMDRYNREWLIERHGHQTPAAVRAAFAADAAA